MSDGVNSFVDSPDSEQEDLLSSNQNDTTSSRELKRLVATAATTAATLGYDVGIMAAAIQPIEAEFGLNSVGRCRGQQERTETHHHTGVLVVCYWNSLHGTGTQL